METFYLFIVIFLFVLAVFDLMVGVSNDAVNFLNSAIGAKAAPFRLVLFIAAIGVFVGAALSNGMMEIARHGIYQPQYFYFEEIMCILLAVMLTDVVLLDLFNTLGMPTSTTVSMVFELLGATFAIAMVKIYTSDMWELSALINSDKALSVIMGIFLSVAIAFFFGMIVQYISRVVFTFNYKKRMKYFIGLFGGIAATSIIYFMLIKGLKDSSIMTSDLKTWVNDNTGMLILYCLIFFTILMQVLYWLKVNVFKVIVLMGTFALALAFAGNDLVNFIGVPLAGYSAYTDFAAQSGASPDSFLMSSLLGPAQTPWYFLFGAGAIMVFALCTSKKAQNVVKTSVNLSRQDEGEEMFGSSPVARVMVRSSRSLVSGLSKIIPQNVQSWLDARFSKDEVILENGAAFDLVRASVNLVLAGLLIAVGTSLKLPLSTTYVTFMVAMGSSLADRAWGRNSAVYRITGVLSVIGGWFITAGAAFTFGALVALILYFGGIIAVFLMIGLAVFCLVRSHLQFNKKKVEKEENVTWKQIMSSTDEREILTLIRDYTREEVDKVLVYAADNFSQTLGAFMNENLRGLRKAMGETKFEKQLLKQMKRQGTLAICRLDNTVMLDKGLYYYQGNDFVSEIVYSIGRMCELCLEHTDNNFKPLSDIQKKEFVEISAEVNIFIRFVREMMKNKEYEKYEQAVSETSRLSDWLSGLKKQELKRLQNESGDIKVSLVYITILQESENLVNYTTNLMKVSRKFQED